MDSNTLRSKYLNFFKKQNHAIVPSSKIVPENDPTTLFTGSGMQPMIGYLLGEKHPLGNRISDSQRCFRAQDIEDVGDNRHSTFFEMLGNWSLGSYFKQEQIPWMFQFLTEEVGLNPANIYVTVFEGDSEIGISEDEESIALWQKLFGSKGIEAKVVRDASTAGMQDGRIFTYPSSKNWWSRAGVPANMPVGEPGGPDSEMFYDFGVDLHLHEKSEYKDLPCHVNCDCGRFLEIGNNVFMEFFKSPTGFEKLPQKNVDFGGGLERLLAAENNNVDIFKTDLFQPIIVEIEKLSGKSYEQSEEIRRCFRVIADHLRASTMLVVDGVYPGNKEQGYFARRLIRRAVRYGKNLGIETLFLKDLVVIVAKMYEEAYPQLSQNLDKIKNIIAEEEMKFKRSLDKGLKEFEKIQTHRSADTQIPFITPQETFNLYETYGFPMELTVEIAKEKGIVLGGSGVSSEAFWEEFKSLKTAHSDKSRQLSAGKFKGGLQDSSQQVTKLHTATHLLNQALHRVLGNHINQAGSNITSDRLRFDFTHSEKITDVQLKQIEDMVNEKIAADLPVQCVVLDKEQALAPNSGIIGVFGDRYGDKVKVYIIGDTEKDTVFSKEICGGPHVEHTGTLGKFKLEKIKSIGSGKMRAYGELV